MLRSIFGAPGPNEVTPLASVLGLRFRDPQFGSMQVWSVIMLANLLGNRDSGSDLRNLSDAAGKEMLAYVTGLLTEARERAKAQASDYTPSNLIEAFAKVEGEFEAVYQKLPADPQFGDLYGRDAGLILVELMGATLATVPHTFSFIMEYLLDHGVDLASLLPELTAEDVERLVLEAERLNPCGRRACGSAPGTRSCWAGPPS